MSLALQSVLVAAKTVFRSQGAAACWLLDICRMLERHAGSCVASALETYDDGRRSSSCHSTAVGKQRIATALTEFDAALLWGNDGKRLSTSFPQSAMNTVTLSRLKASLTPKICKKKCSLRITPHTFACKSVSIFRCLPRQASEADACPAWGTNPSSSIPKSNTGRQRIKPKKLPVVKRRNCLPQERVIDHLLTKAKKS